MRRLTVFRLCTMVSKRTPPEELITSACHGRAAGTDCGPSPDHPSLRDPRIVQRGAGQRRTA